MNVTPATSFFVLITALAMLVAANPVAGQEPEWQLFSSDESRFVFDVPPGFEISQRAEQGKGVMFEGPNGALLTIWSADLAKEEFKAQIESQMAQDRTEGWDLTYVRVTADWASYSGIKEDQIRYFRAINVCSDRAAVFLFDYPRNEKLAYDPVVVRMVRSLKVKGC